MFKDEGLEIAYVSPHYYDQATKSFSQHVSIEEDDLHIVQEPYTPDLLWVRMNQALYHVDEMFADADFVTVPTMRLKHIDTDKYQMYKYLKDFQPTSSLLTSYYFYPWMKEQFGDRVVVKPISWSGGYGINFYGKDEMNNPEVFEKYSGTEWLHLIQDYKNFSQWAPGITNGTHDLRIVFFGTRPAFSIVRVPAEWSLKSNIAAWWYQFSLPLNDIPQEVIEMCQQAQEALWVTIADMYSLDFAYCKEEERRYIIEMNSSPGIWFPDEDRAYQEQFFMDVATYFHDILELYQIQKEHPELPKPLTTSYLSSHLVQERRKDLVAHYLK